MQATTALTIDAFRGKAYSVVTEQEFKKSHQVFDGAPNQWASDRGATHTLYCGEGHGRGTRPARLMKTVMMVGVDESETGDIVWEKWNLLPRRTLRFQP